MIPAVHNRIPELERLCQRYHVRRLYLFGSAATGAFDEDTSDLDFLVEFQPAVRGVYFDLLEDLKRVFDRPVDLVMEAAIKNPYFRISVEETRIPIYGASQQFQQAPQPVRRFSMKLESLKYLYDIRLAARAIRDFTTGKTFSDYQDDLMLRSAVERQFGIIGEATSGLARVDEATAGRITDYPQVIAFRNVLIHEYPEVVNSDAWDKIVTYPPTLVSEVEALLSEAGDDDRPRR